MAESKWSGGGGSSGTGTITGPGFNTDNAVARWDGVGGTVIQDSVVTIGDTGIISGGIQLTLRDDASLPGAGDNMIRLENRNDTPASHAHLEFRKARASNADLANGDEVGGINFHGRHNSSTASLIDILGIYTGDGTTRTGDLSILLASAGAPAERVRITGAGSVQVSSLTASHALVTDGSKGLVSSVTTATELGHVSGVTSAIQTQMNLKAPSASPTFTGTVTAATLTATGVCTLGTAGTTMNLNVLGKSTIASGAGSGVQISAIVHNTSNTASAMATLKLYAGGTSADSASIVYWTGSGSNSWQVGNRCSDSAFGWAYNGTETMASGIMGSVTTAGVWTFGPAATSAIAAHTFNGTGGLSVLSSHTGQTETYLHNADTTAASGSILLVSANDGNTRGIFGAITGSPIRIGSYSNTAVEFVRNNTSVIGGYDTAGAWTLGGTANGASHIMKGYSPVGGNASGNGSLKLGGNAGVGLVLHFDTASSTTGYIDSEYDYAGTAVQFRMRTSGTPVVAGSYTGAGAWTFPLIHNIGAGNITSGTYSPTLSASTNVASSIVYDAQYMRVGNVVTVSGYISITPTAATTTTNWDLTLPIASAMTSAIHLGGTFVQEGGSATADYNAGRIQANDTTDKALFLYAPSHNGTKIATYTFTYVVL